MHPRNGSGFRLWTFAIFSNNHTNRYHIPQLMDRDDIFEPYDKLVKIRLLGVEREVPENNSILRGLQFLDMETISYGDFCWNGECINCQVWIKNGDKEKGVMACRTNVEEGMEIVRVSDGMKI
jgi:hypothetical protein